MELAKGSCKDFRGLIVVSVLYARRAKTKTHPIQRAKSYVRGSAGPISEILGVPPLWGCLW